MGTAQIYHKNFDHIFTHSFEHQGLFHRTLLLRICTDLHRSLGQPTYDSHFYLCSVLFPVSYPYKFFHGPFASRRVASDRAPKVQRVFESDSPRGLSARI